MRPVFIQKESERLRERQRGTCRREQCSQTGEELGQGGQEPSRLLEQSRHRQERLPDSSPEALAGWGHRSSAPGSLHTTSP